MNDTVSGWISLREEDYPPKRKEIIDFRPIHYINWISFERTEGMVLVTVAENERMLGKFQYIQTAK